MKRVEVRHDGRQWQAYRADTISAHAVGRGATPGEAFLDFAQTYPQALGVAVSVSPVIVVAQFGGDSFEGRVRNFVGEGSVQLEGVPVVSGSSVQEIREKLAEHIPTAMTAPCVIREDPFLTQ